VNQGSAVPPGYNVMQQRLCQHFQTGAIEALTVAAPCRGAGRRAAARHLATARGGVHRFCRNSSA